MRRTASFELQGRGGGPDLVAPVKGAIWFYFWLLLGEGILRKWVLPGFSDVLLLVRDPVAVLNDLEILGTVLRPRCETLIARASRADHWLERSNHGNWSA